MKGRKEKLTSTLLLRLTPAERIRLQKLALVEQRSMAAQVRVLLRQSLDQLQAAA